MERSLTRWILILKVQLRKWTFYLQLAVFVFVIYTFAGTHLPSADNCSIVIVTNDQKVPQEVFEKLEDSDSMFTFIKASDDEELDKMVMSGRAECGFEFSDDFDKRVLQGNLDGSIRCVTSDLTTKGLTAKETVFASFNEVYGSRRLTKGFNTIFRGDLGATKDNVLNSDNRLDDSDIDSSSFKNYAASRYSGYLSGNRVFKVIFKEQDN